MNGGSDAHVEARPWVRGDDGSYRCRKHEQAFTLPATCTACEADPALPSTQEPAPALPKAPKGCKSSVTLERRFVAIAEASRKDVDRLGKQARELANQVLFDGSAVAGKPKAKPKKQATFDFHLERNMAAHRETEIKALRAATELALQREDAELVRLREKRLLELGAGAQH